MVVMLLLALLFLAVMVYIMHGIAEAVVHGDTFVQKQF